MSNPKLVKNGGKGTNVGNALRWLAKQGKEVAPELLSIAGNITGIESLNNLSNKIKGDAILSDIDKELLLKELEYDMIEMQEVTKRWQSDMSSDSYWSKNIRPLSLAFLTVTLFIYIILDSSIEGFKIDSNWIDLLSSLLLLVYGGYFGARS
jgi:hypothetical protein